MKYLLLVILLAGCVSEQEIQRRTSLRVEIDHDFRAFAKECKYLEGTLNTPPTPTWWEKQDAVCYFYDSRPWRYDEEYPRRKL